MKNIFTKLLAVTIICSICLISGCKKNESITESVSESGASSESSTIAKSVVEDFKNNANGSPEDIANKLLENPLLDFGGMAVSVDNGPLNGFNGEIEGFSEGAMFSPVIGTIPFVGYVFKVDGSTSEFIEYLKSKADLRWNICTQADDMEADSVGDLVVFVMAPREL